jgi:hypothetical protein
MSQKFVLWTAAALTAFVLFVGGAVAGRISQPQQPANTVSTAEVNALLAQREAQYQALIEQANTQLTDAYRSLQNASPSEVAVQATAEPTPSWISIDQAMSAAVLSVPGSRVVRLPELVDFQGATAYEVRLNTGIVYIDASNGALLFNGAAQQTANNDFSQFSNPSHEDDDHDD